MLQLAALMVGAKPTARSSAPPKPNQQPMDWREMKARMRGIAQAQEAAMKRTGERG